MLYDLSDFQRGEIALALEDFDMRTFSSIVGTLRALSPADSWASQLLKAAPIWAGTMEALSLLRLSNLAISVRDIGWHKRFWSADAQLEGWKGDLSEYAKKKMAPQRSQLLSELENQGLSRTFASDFVEKFFSYAQRGGELRFSTKIARPVPLFKRDGLGVAPYLTTFGQFVELSSARLEWRAP
ncbi:MAG: hypothetical protein ACRECO_00735 [Xanthobacteraceae bacterium]